MKSGILCLYKEKGFTSHDAVALIRRFYGTKKVGHTGTLDPQATGVLPILIGGAVKACDLIPEETKIYRAVVKFGIETDTEDVWGKTIKTDSTRPNKEDFLKAAESFLGEYMQIPPMVSAVKIDGKKLYEYQREGKMVERQARPVFVHALTVTSFSEEEASVVAEVSKGTYIRTLLTDLCKKVGCLGAMSALEREKSGIFTLEKAVRLEKIEEMTLEEREGLLVPVETIFSLYPKFEIPTFFDRLIANGCRVNVKKLGLADEKVGQRFRLYQNGKFFALGEIKAFEGEICLCKIKDFPPDIK
ncbi:MAG: tRNA pseudouridine(55) synthase TruB [Clostridia bacterium]|nr:tRNA pseudouridine(55) synthase TruB [Clostridia bacterium]